MDQLPLLMDAHAIVDLPFASDSLEIIGDEEWRALVRGLLLMPQSTKLSRMMLCRFTRVFRLEAPMSTHPFRRMMICKSF